MPHKTRNGDGLEKVMRELEMGPISKTPFFWPKVTCERAHKFNTPRAAFAASAWFETLAPTTPVTGWYSTCSCGRKCPPTAPQTRRRVNTTVARGSARLGTARLTRTRRMTIEVSTPSPAGTPPKPPQSSSSSSKKLIKDQLALVDVKTADGGTRKEVRPFPSLSDPSSPFSMRGFQPARSMRPVTRRIRLARLTRARRPPERRVAAPAPLPSEKPAFCSHLAP